MPNVPLRVIFVVVPIWLGWRDIRKSRQWRGRQHRPDRLGQPPPALQSGQASPCKTSPPRIWPGSSKGAAKPWLSPAPAFRWSPGIPDFRSKGGLWERFDPLEYATIRAFKKDPAKVWAMLREMDRILVKARPNPAHYALAELEKPGALPGHHHPERRQPAPDCGQPPRRRVPRQRPPLQVPETCKGQWPREALDFDQTPLYCHCGGLITAGCGLLREGYPGGGHVPGQRPGSCQRSHADHRLFHGGGPTCSPRWPKNNGAVIVENNLEHTPDLTRFLTDYFLPGKAGQVWPEVMQAIE